MNELASFFMNLIIPVALYIAFKLAHEIGHVARQSISPGLRDRNGGPRVC